MIFSPADPDFEARVRASFALQTMMSTLGAEMIHVAPGEIDLAMFPQPQFTQQNGFIHAGAVASIMDSACGYAAMSLMPAEVDALTVEFKINLLRPAQGMRLIALGRLIKAGKTLTVCEGRCVAETDSGEKLIATMTNTVMTIRD